MKRDAGVRVGLGVPSLVLILLVLCLALLGMLSLISARTDYSMTLRQAQLAAAYAEADAAAQCALAELDAQMVQAWKGCTDDAAYADACRRIARAGDTDVVWIDGESALLEFDAGAQRVLSVEISRFPWREAGNQRFKINQYGINNGSEWIQTESLELIDAR